MARLHSPPVPVLSRLLTPLGATLSACALGIAVALNPLVGAALLVPTVVAGLLVVPAVGFPFLVAASAVNRLAIPWGDAEIRVEIIVALLLAGMLINRLLVRTLQPGALRSPLTLPLVGYAVINLLSTVLFARERTRGLHLDAEIGLVVIAYLVVIALIRTRADFRQAMTALWIITVGEALVGLLLAAAYVVHLTPYGVQIDNFGLPQAYGTEWEANIFGSYLLGNFFLLLADYVSGRRSLLYSAGLVLVVVGIAISMTRTVWLALVLGMLVFLPMTLWARRTAGSLALILAAVPVLALAGLIVGSATPFAGRLLDLVNLQTSSAVGRLASFSAAIADWRHHPILGSGTGSYDVGAVPGQPHPWLGNIFLLTLHDTGLVGLFILLLLIVSFYRVCLGSLHRHQELAVLIAGGTAGFTALLLAFQTTSGFWFVYPWIVVGATIAACRLAREGT